MPSGSELEVEIRVSKVHRNLRNFFPNLELQLWFIRDCGKVQKGAKVMFYY